MNATEFENTIRHYLRQSPFQPFEVILISGKAVEIMKPVLAMGGGGFTFIREDYELVEIECENVREIRLLTAGATS